MPLQRRALLAGVAAAAGTLAGCSGGGEGSPVVVQLPGSDTGDDPEDVTTVEDPRLAHHVFTPDIKGWDAERAEDGRIRLRVEMQNVDPDPVAGNLQAEFRVNGTLRRYNASFSLPANESRTVDVTYPVPYETLREGGYLRLRVPSVNETD